MVARCPTGHHYGPSDAPAVPPLSPGALPPDSPPGATLHDFTYDTAAAAWVPWAQLAAAAPPIPASATFASILVPTPDTEAVTFLLRTAIDGRWAAGPALDTPRACQARRHGIFAVLAHVGVRLAGGRIVLHHCLLCLANWACILTCARSCMFPDVTPPCGRPPSIDVCRYPFLLVGPTGTGKSVVVQRCLLGLGQDAFAPPNLIGFSAQTSANATQALVDAKLDKRRKVGRMPLVCTAV